jgi:catechol 2,3-dioxygenase-like lactoylglutathione lyase family enzyme
MNTPLTHGAHHIGLTVPDLTATRRFFVETLGFDEVGNVPDYPAVFVSDGTTLITLWRAEDPATAVPFDRRRNVGLHHLALKVDPEALPELHEKLVADPDVVVEFAPEHLGKSSLQHMMCFIPGGVRMEFIGIAAP